MSSNHKRDWAAMDPVLDREEFEDLKRGGSGAASALERMKADHALRRKRQHGARNSGAGREDDQSPER